MISQSAAGRHHDLHFESIHLCEIGSTCCGASKTVDKPVASLSCTYNMSISLERALHTSTSCREGARTC